MGFDLTQLDRAATRADELADLLAEANGDKADPNESKIIRDKAYTYMKTLVDEIREAGKYVFRNNKNRLKGYTTPVTTGENYTENKAAIRMMWLNTYVSCRHVGRPACFLPALHGFYASLRRRIIKKCCRKGKKAAEIIKNAAGLKKSPQEMPKVLQAGY
jgi:hypothetical protein